jgi:hypothetical protein
MNAMVVTVKHSSPAKAANVPERQDEQEVAPGIKTGTISTCKNFIAPTICSIII